MIKYFSSVRYKAISILIFLSFATIFFPPKCIGQIKTHYFINPGFKIGYAFGNNGGFTYGAEISFVMIKKELNSDSHHYGFVVDYDCIGNVTKLHFGLEYSYLLIGLDIGPTFGWKEEQGFTGFSIIPYTGIFAFPHYNFTYLGEGMIFHEFGSYFKLPIQLDTKRYVWFKRD